MGLKELQGLQGATRFTITFIIAVTVIFSPVFLLDNPTHEHYLAATTTSDDLNRVDSSKYHSALRLADTPLAADTTAPSTISQDGDFTTQAALSLTRASQTSNIVNSKAYYDTSFRTATAGTIKTVEIDFPLGTYVGVATLTEVVGLGPGKIAASGSTGTGMKITYTVTNAVNVPAFTNIRIQIANINNPQEPSASYMVTITTKDATSTIIDGPSTTNAYNMKQIGTADIADNAVTTAKIADDAITTDKVATSFAYERILADGESGWNPNDSAINFAILDPLFDVAQSIVVINLDGDSVAPIATCAVSNLAFEAFTVTCTSAPPNGAELRYVVFNPAAAES